MIYQTDKIVRDVRLSLDENVDMSELTALSDTDTLELEDIIRSKILEAVRRVHILAAPHLLENGHHFADGAIYWDSKESGHILLPDDFMRLVVFEMSDWERPVFTAISTDDPAYAACRSRIKALRGTPERPVCAIARHSEGLALEFYSCQSEEAVVTRDLYMPYPREDEQGGVDISEPCYTAVIYLCAALTLVAQGNTEKGNALSELAKTYIS